MKAISSPLIAILSGLLLFAAWPMSPLTFLVFVALVPLFWLEAHAKNGARFFWLVALNMLIWNVATTWWIWNASPDGAIGAFVANSLLMCFPWMLFRFTKKKLGDTIGYTSFILYWISWEYIHHNWDLSWPWLTLGNIFSTSTGWVRWYQYTGTTGGSLWVLLANVLVYKALFSSNHSKSISFNSKKAATAAVAILLPIGLSYIAFGKWQPGQAAPTNNIVVVQPNVESYTEKFNTDPGILIDKMIALSESQLDSNTRLVVWPETAIPVQVFEHEIASNGYFQKVFAFAKRHPRIMLLTGIDSYKLWGQAGKKGFSIRTMQDGNQYEAFNTAFATDSSGAIQLYHKSKLVPGPETLPSWLGFMGSIFEELGGSSGTLGKSDSAIVFASPGNPYHPAPIICYESIYSNYVTEYVRNGANVLAVITNDGWWGNTPGYQQHESMARLRAIETGCWVARSANTGISCFIAPDGRVINPQLWESAAAIKMGIPPQDGGQTFYVRMGDWLSRLAWPVAVLVLLWAVAKNFSKKRQLA